MNGFTGFIGRWPAAAMMVGERDQLTPPRRNYPPQIPLRWVSGARYSNLRSSRNGGLGGKMEAGGSERDSIRSSDRRRTGCLDVSLINHRLLTALVARGRRPFPAVSTRDVKIDSRYASEEGRAQWRVSP